MELVVHARGNISEMLRPPAGHCLIGFGKLIACKSLEDVA